VLNFLLDSNKWRFIPVWPSIPGGPMYTIRNVVSGLALSMNTKVAPSISLLEKRGSRTAGAIASAPQLVGRRLSVPPPLTYCCSQWQVEPLLNRKFHLKNSSLNLFLRLLKDYPILPWATLLAVKRENRGN